MNVWIYVCKFHFDRVAAKFYYLTQLLLLVPTTSNEFQVTTTTHIANYSALKLNTRKVKLSSSRQKSIQIKKKFEL